MTISDDAMETTIRIESLKMAAMVMNGIAEGIKDEKTRNETKSLAWVITWAVKKIEATQ